MGKKGSWFSAIKRVFTPNSKDKESDKRNGNGKEKKWKGLGKLRHSETKSFIPLFREPSSIEKILGEAEREHKEIFRPPTPSQQPSTPLRVPSPRVPSQRNSPPKVSSPKAVSPPRRARSPPPRPPSPRAASPPPRPPPPRAASPPPRPPSPRAASPPPRPPSPRVASPLPRPPSPRAPSPPPRPPQRTASPRIIRQRSEPTLQEQFVSATKIQAAYRAYTARRSFRAIKGLVRLQGVVGGQNVKRQTTNAMKYMQLMVRVQSQIQSRRIQMLENKARLQAKNEAESTMSKNGSEAGNWDDSVLTKEEREARMQRKVEANVKRERAMAYAYSNQLWKTNSKSAVSDTRAGAFPWWWNWLERSLPSATPPETRGTKSIQLTPPRPASSSSKQYHSGYNPAEASTPKSTKSTVYPASKFMWTPPSHRLSQGSSSGMPKYSNPRSRGADSPFNFPLKDDDSLISCPPFSVPNYMTPTVSAKAKVRANSNPRERFPASPSASEASRRLSFPLTQGRSFKHQSSSSAQSVSNMSVSSTVSVGRKPFNRFV